MVELTIALHYLFDTPKDRLVWDVGHQAYPHKILTERRDRIRTLRKGGGLSGFTKRSESIYDPFGAAHSSTSISASLGMAVARDLDDRNNNVIAVIGDGAMSAGMAYEAMNNAGSMKSRLIVILNDNDMSIAPPVGAMRSYLAKLLSGKTYIGFRGFLKKIASLFPRSIKTRAARFEEYFRGLAVGGTLFDELGFYYVGTINGHDFDQLIPVLKNVRDSSHKGPFLVHAITQKGKGYKPAESSDDKYHGVNKFDVVTGAQVKSTANTPTYTKVYGDTLAKHAEIDSKIIAITGAMPSGTGVDIFAKKFPTRTFDVGIAEQHAATSAAGMAFAGLHPVFAVYSTFLNRAFDQLLLDVALHKAGVTFVLDRAGITGDDGPSHNGIWDLALTGIVPTLHVAAPRDGQQLRETLREAINISDAPSLIRFPKGSINPDIPAFERRDGIDVLYRGESADILLVSIGAFATIAVEAAAQAYREGVGVTVIDPRWVKPLPTALVTMAQRYKSVVVLEDGIKHGGIASTISELFRESQLNVPVHSIGVPLTFLEHSKRNQILEDLGITVQNITRSLVAWSSTDNSIALKAEMQHPLDENERRKPLR